jgi:hypothetical protein
MKENEMAETQRGTRKRTQFFVGKYERNRSFARPRRRWETNIKM